MTQIADKTTSFLHKGYLVDVVKTKNNYEAWIGDECEGIKHLMFAMPKTQQTYKCFLEIAEANIEGYIETIF